MSLRTSLIIILTVLLVAIISGCTGQEEQTTPEASGIAPEPTATPMPTAVPPTATPLTEPAVRLANVDSLEILNDAVFEVLLEDIKHRDRGLIRFKPPVGYVVC